MGLLNQNNFNKLLEFFPFNLPNNQTSLDVHQNLFQKIIILLITLLPHFLTQMNKIMLIILMLQNLMKIMLKMWFFHYLFIL